MLQLKLSLDNIEDETGKRIVLHDTTGDYSTTNTGGYGAPNSTRDKVAVFPVVYLISSKGEKTLLKLDPFNPLTSNSWNIITQTDGWYSSQLVYASVDTIPLITNYKEGDIVFSSTTYKLLKVVKAPSTVSTTTLSTTTLVFVEIQPEDLLSVNSSVPVDQLFIANLSFTKIALNRAKIELIINSENLSNDSRIREVQSAYDQVRSFLQGAIYEFCIGNKYEAARFIEFLLTNNYSQLSLVNA